MTEQRDVTVEGIKYRVVISDEQEALLAAKAAGRAFIGVLKEHGDGAGAGFWGAAYAVDSPEAVDDRLLERVVRRKLGLPWVIAESERLRIREFTPGDAAEIPRENEEMLEDSVFYTPEKLAAYIRGQYGYYEYGVWAVERKSDSRIVGKAGVSDCDIRRWRKREEDGRKNGAELQLELGYHIFRPYRRQGYAEEACRLILNYVKQEYDCPVYASVAADNRASIRLIDRLGFSPCDGVSGTGAAKAASPDITARKYNGSELPPCLYAWNLPSP